MTERRFPIHPGEKAPGPRSVPWSLVVPFEDAAQWNHQQSLERLAQRGGLDYSELAAVVGRRKWRRMTEVEVAEFVATLPVEVV